MKSAKFLDDVKTKLALHTDKELAEHFGVTKAAISQYKSGTRIMENEMCLAIALTLEIEPMRVIMAADIDRAERSGQHSLWEVFSQRMAATAACMLLASSVNLFLTPGQAEAAQVKAPLHGHESHSLYYVKFSDRR